MNSKEELLMEKETGFKALFENANIGIIIVNKDGQIKFSNYYSDEIFGYKKQELNGKPLEILIPQVFLKNHKNLYQEYFDHPKPQLIRKTLSLKAVKRDGEEFPVEISLTHYESGGELMAVAFVKEVTEKMKIIDVLKANEEKYRNLYHNSVISKHTTDFTTLKPIEVNEVAVKLFGYKSKQDFMDNFTPSKHAISVSDFKENIKTLKNKGEILNLAQEMKKVDGTHFWANIFSKLDSTKMFSQTVIVDITEQINALKKAKESEERYKVLFENSLVSMHTTDLKTFRAVNANEIAVKLFGYKSKEDFLRDFSPGKHYVNEDDLKTNSKVFFESGEIVNQQLEMKRLDGKHFWASLNIKLCNDKTKANTVILDITKQVKANEKLKLSEEKFRNLYENSVVSMLTYNIKERRVEDVNDVCVQLFGYKSRKKFIADFEKTNHFINLDERQLLIDSLEKKGETNLISEFRRKNGTHFWANIFAKVNHDKTELQAVIIDITESKRTHEQLETEVKERTLELTAALEREKEMNDIKTRFVSTASHEFRTPLSAILSSVSIIEAYDKAEDEPNRTKHFERIKSSVNNLVDILNDFLSVDKLEQGKMELKLEKFDVKVFAEDVLEEVKGILKKGQKMNFDFSGILNIVLDKKILKNILLNLLSNAIKYSSENNSINMKIESKKKLILINVQDNGIGIPEEEQKNLFGKFFRAGNAANIQGTGLGLNIVKKYVELLNGNITFVSGINKGTTFFLSFPQK